LYYVIKHKMHFCKYGQSHIIFILHQHTYISIIPVTIKRVPYNKNKIYVQLIVQNV
jgi:hypothetical protein